MIDDDVAYALQIARCNLDVVRACCNGELRSLRILEIGPGYDFGPQIILADAVAEVRVADRFLAEWHDDYHPAFYRQLQKAWGQPCASLEKVIVANDARRNHTGEGTCRRYANDKGCQYGRRPFECGS